MAARSDLRLILASASPRRQAFFRDLGLRFDVVVADVDEAAALGEGPIELARRLATAKARAAAEQLTIGGDRRLVVAADTVVAKDDRILGKPADAAEAMLMLLALRNGPHQVHSGVSVLETHTGRHLTAVNSTTVIMRDYRYEEIERYIDTGDPFDKAGAYAIQHPEFAPAVGIDGCLSGVMGLPLADLSALLADFGVVPACPVEAVCEQHGDFSCCQRVRAGGRVESH